MQRRNNQIDGAMADLRRIISEFPQAPEAEAARVWLNTIKPAPPGAAPQKP
jgi:TolA-binding protein